MESRFKEVTANNPDTLLQEGEPDTATIRTGNSPILFMGPHNGFRVPRKLYQDGKPLGLDPKYFDENSGHAIHEVADLNVARHLWPQLQAQHPEANFIGCPYSRLVIDVNRNPACATKSTAYTQENGILIPANQGLDKEGSQDAEQRMDEIFYGFHNQASALIQKIKADNNGEIFILDIHSCTPSMNGVPRPEIGILDIDHNLYAMLFEDYLENSDFSYIPGNPYDLTSAFMRERNAAPWMSERNNINYLGVELRNDLIDTPEKTQRIITFLAGFVDLIENYPDKHLLIKQSRIRQHIPSQEPEEDQPLFK